MSESSHADLAGVHQSVRLPSRVGFTRWLVLTACLLGSIAGYAAYEARSNRQLLVERLQTYEAAHPEHREAVQVLVRCSDKMFADEDECGLALYASQGDESMAILAKMAEEGVFR